MKTVHKVFESFTEVNRSKFLAFLVPYDQFEGMQERLRQLHPKANHVVYALRYINAYDQVVENSSDDGEPKGCAGVPALNVLRGESLVNCAVLIVRYFGGIKLGTGGMARAYAQAVKEVVSSATLVVWEKMLGYRFATSYSDVEKILYRLKQLGIESYEREFGVAEVVWVVQGTQAQIEALQKRIDWMH